MIKEINLPNEVSYIIKQLNKNGYKAYIVGGCVRDTLMGKLPKDWDIATSALPDKTKSIFKNTYDTGIQHGTVTVVIEGKAFEVTTFRIDGKYQDYRRPLNVSYTQDIIKDLSRRDFTINAIAYHPIDGFIDPFEGTKDITNKLIACVGEPKQRFNEDALRMLRAVRFSITLNFDIEIGTKMAIIEQSNLIKKVSSERIREEFNKILLSQKPSRLTIMTKLNLLKYILPEFEVCFDTEQNHPYHIYDVGTHSLKALDNIRENIILRWVMLLHDIGKPPCKTTDELGIDHFYGHQKVSTQMTKDILKRFRFDNKAARKIGKLVKYHDRYIELNPKAVRRAVRQIGEDIFLELLEVKLADAKAQNPEKFEETLNYIERVKQIYTEIKEKDDCLSIKNLAINGHDLIKIGIPEGEEIGQTLKSLLELVIDEPELNKKEQLIKIVKDMHKK